MAVTAERFEQGLTYEAYKAQMTRNKERLEENETTVDIDPAAVDAFQRLAQPLNVLVIAEDWCGDVIANLPVLGRLAEQTDKLNVRVFLRDQNLDLMNMYLNQGQFQSIPVFAFFDADFNPIAHLIERPATVTETMDRKRAEIFARNPDFGPPDQSPAEMSEDVRTRFMQEFVLARTETRPFSNSEVQREFREIAEQAAR
ncbi:MAG: thioredoxin family protein [Chloroflexales bacterium]|nr:thioredoxin family protein [Chloroflexales bacterium]